MKTAVVNMPEVVEYRPTVCDPDLCIWVQLFINHWKQLDYFCTHPRDKGSFCQLVSEGYCDLYLE